MEQHVLMLAFDYRGHYWKGIKKLIMLKCSFKQNLCFNEQKCIFENCRKVNTIKIFMNTFLVFKNLLCLPFQSCHLWAQFNIRYRCAVPLKWQILFHQLTICWARALIGPIGKSYWRGGLSTIDLLVLTNLDQPILYWKYDFPFYQTS